MFKKIIKLGFVLGVWVLMEIPLAKAAVTPPSFSLSPTSGTYYVGCDVVQLDILIHTNNTATDSANVIINYDPAELEVVDMDGGTDGKQISSGSAYTNYTGNTVDEDTGTIRLTGFNVLTTYNSGSGFGTFGTIYFNVLQSGSSNVTIDFTQGSTTDSNIAETITSDDILNAVENATLTLSDDTTDPTIYNQSPTNGATGVAVSQNVTFRISDQQCGVDLNSINATVGGVTYTRSGGNTFSYSGNTSDYLITVNPSQNFSFNTQINVSLLGQDAQDNEDTSSYSFTTIDDTQGPAVTNRSPAPDATNVAKNTNIYFTISDSGSGVDLSTVGVTVNGTLYQSTGDHTFQYSGGASSYNITVNPATDFARSDEVSVSIVGSDLLDNEMTQVDYSFDIVANQAPVLTTITDKSISAGGLLTFIVQASDADGDTVTISTANSTLPSSSTYTAINSTTGIFTWQSSAGDDGEYSIDFIATDDGPGGVSDTESVAITVTGSSGENVAPVIAEIADQDMFTGTDKNFLINVSDANSDTLTITAVTTNQTALTLTNITNGIAVLNADADLLERGTNTITITATDDGDPALSDTEIFIIDVGAVATCTCPTCTTCQICETTTCPEVRCPTLNDTYKEMYLELYKQLEKYRNAAPETKYSIVELVEIQKDLEEISISLPDEIEGARVKDEQEKLEEQKACVMQKTRYIPVYTEKKEAVQTDLVVSVTNDIERFKSQRFLFDKTKNQSPTLLAMIPKNNATEVALSQPIVFVVVDDKGLDMNKLKFTINDEAVYYEVKVNSDKGYPEYTVIHIPEKQFPANTKMKIEIHIEEEEHEGERKFQRNLVSYFTTGENDITEEMLQTAKINITPVSIGLNVKNIEIIQDNKTGGLEVVGSVSRRAEVKAIWHGGEETITISKQINGQKFVLEAPMGFDDGNYFVEIVAVDEFGTETNPIQIKFKIYEDKLVGENDDLEVMHPKIEKKETEQLQVTNEKDYTNVWIIVVIMFFVSLILFLGKKYAE